MNAAYARECVGCHTALVRDPLAPASVDPFAPDAPPAEAAAPPPAPATGPPPVEVGPTAVVTTPKTGRAGLFFEELMRPDPPAPPPAPAEAVAPEAAPAAPAASAEPAASVEPAAAVLDANVASVVPTSSGKVRRFETPSAPRSPARSTPSTRRSPVLVAVAFSVSFVGGLAIGSALPAKAAPADAGRTVARGPRIDPALPGGLVQPGDVFRFTFENGRRGEYRIESIHDGPIGTVRAAVRVTGGAEGPSTYLDDKPYRVPMVPPTEVPEVAREVLTVSNERFECAVHEVTGVAGDVRRFWFSRRYPYLLKQTSGSSVLLELTEIVPVPR